MVSFRFFLIDKDHIKVKDAEGTCEPRLAGATSLTMWYNLENWNRKDDW
jgi:hypothetical protein